ncbi:hypothetical protein CM15mP43_12790 [bacterium]|nr:MAG: hypothetical protein CM15mP43_12790 [bacterium]
MLRENDALDFDDLLLFPLQDLLMIIQKFLKISKSLKYILVDEYQDTNKPQFCFLSRLQKTIKISVL